MKFGKYILEYSVPEWKHKYINYKKLKEAIKNCLVENEVVLSIPSQDSIDSTSYTPVDSQNWSQLVPEATVREVEFITKYQRQVMKFAEFYKLKVQESLAKYEELEQQCAILERESREGDSVSESETENPKFVARVSNPTVALSKVVLEFFYMLQLLDNYRILNEMASAKIIKKFKRARSHDMSKVIQATKEVMDRDKNVPKELVRNVERLYLQYFANDGNLKKRKEQLGRLKAKSKPEPPVTLTNSWRVGFFTGVSIPVLISVLATILQLPSTPKDAFIMQIFGGLSIPIYFVYIFGWCMSILQTERINWVLIFELDPLSFSTPLQLEQFGAALLLFYSLTVYLALGEGRLASVDPQILAMVFLGSVIAIITLPFNIFQQKGRYWLLETLKRIVLSGTLIVQFRDFFMCDLLSSMGYSFVALESIICSIFTYPNGFEQCDLQKSWLPSVVIALPSYWRLLQCFRRYHEHKLVHPHLTNAIKYVLALFTIFLSTCSKILNSNGFLYAWICFACVTSIYSYLWDVMFDWGLFRESKKHRYLREEITFSPWFYYFALVANLFLRFTWVILLSPSQWNFMKHAQVVVYALGLLEIVRRAIWVLLRMENEHANNIGNYRVTKELPMPFEIIHTTHKKDNY